MEYNLTHNHNCRFQAEEDKATRNREIVTIIKQDIVLCTLKCLFSSHFSFVDFLLHSFESSWGKQELARCRTGAVEVLDSKAASAILFLCTGRWELGPDPDCCFSANTHEKSLGWGPTPAAGFPGCSGGLPWNVTLPTQGRNTDPGFTMFCSVWAEWPGYLYKRQSSDRDTDQGREDAWHSAQAQDELWAPGQSWQIAHILSVWQTCKCPGGFAGGN